MSKHTSTTTALPKYKPNERVRVLHLITQIVIGGAQDNTLLTCEGHNRERYAVDIASDTAEGFRDRAIATADNFHPIPHLMAPVSPWNDLRALFEIIALFRRERYDIVHLHSSKASFLGRLAGFLTGTTCVYTYHAFPYNGFMSKWKRMFYIYLERAAKPLAKYYGTLSENDRQEGIGLGFIPEDRSKRIYTGIKLDKYAFEIDRAAVRKELGIADHEMGIVLVGRMEPSKAPDVMVEAFAKLMKAKPDSSRLYIVGDGELKQMAEALACELGVDQRVHFLGTRKDVPVILKAMDVFAFSSRWEAMGRAMLEAMICGIPVIAPILCGIPEVVKDGETGFLYPAADTDKLAEGLAWYVDHPQERKEMGAAAQAFICPLFDHKVMVDSVEDMFELVLSEKAKQQAS